jgi:hypothetical protein
MSTGDKLAVKSLLPMRLMVRGKTGGRPRTDVIKLRDAKVLYENSGKTADEVCKVVGVDRRSFFAYLALQRDQPSTPSLPIRPLRGGWTIRA